MRAIGIVGSPRKGGNTELLVSRILKGAEKAGADTEVFNLSEINVGGCRGCMACKKKGRCIVNDDMQKLYNEIQNADVIVFGSPVYFFQMSGQLKLMVDRLIAFLNPDFTTRLKQGKTTVLAFTQGQANPDIYKDYFQHTANAINFIGFNVEDIITIGGSQGKKGDIHSQEEALQKAEDAGKKAAQKYVQV